MKRKRACLWGYYKTLEVKIQSSESRRQEDRECLKRYEEGRTA
jgi:hypothetical protein